MAKTLPATLPADTTPTTYTGTKVKVFLLDPSATSIASATVTVGTAVTAGAVSASLSVDNPVTIPNGTTLNFGGKLLTLTADFVATTTPASTAIAAAPAGGVPVSATASYSTARQVPVTEDISPSLKDDEETIKLQGRATPIRVMNGKDFTATLKTVAGVTDPVVKELITAGSNLSGGTGAASNLKRLIFQFDDGFALLALCNIGAPMADGKAGTAQRYTFNANSTGALYWTDMNAATPTWTQIGAVI